MTAKQGMERLEPALVHDAQGRYCFACQKAFVMLKVLGAHAALCFAARDKVAFRIDAASFTVEQLGSGRVRNQFAWEQLESLAAGEQETESGDLFQG